MKPVAWRIRDQDGCLIYEALEPSTFHSSSWLVKCKEITPLYAIPPGYVIVPMEPICGENYEAGLWSRRNYEAWLEDQAEKENVE